MKDIIKHAREFLRAVRNGHYEHTDDGRILFPKQKILLGGVFDHSVNGADHRRDANLFVAQGRDNILDIFQNQVGQNGGGYFLAPFSGNVAIADNLTAATFTATQTEFTSYASSTRVAWVKNGASASQSISNSSSPAQFTINVTGPSTIWGVGMLTASAKLATTGFLEAATQFSAARSGLLNGDVLSVAYTLSATSS